MTILNRDELNTQLLTRIPDNSTNFVTPANVRDQILDERDSLAPRGAVLANETQIDDIAVSTSEVSPTIVQMAINRTSENELFIPQQANNRIIVKEPAFYLATVRFQGRWAAGEDLNWRIHLNGAANPFAGGSIAQEGQGTNDPVTISITRTGFLINAAAVAADPSGEGGATVEMVMWSTTGNFNVDQLRAELGLEYNQLSIRTVG